MDRPIFGTRRIALIAASLGAALSSASIGQHASAIRAVRKVPLASLGNTMRRQLTSHGYGHSTTYFPPSKRNGARERERRVRQMANGTHGYTRAE